MNPMMVFAFLVSFVTASASKTLPMEAALSVDLAGEGSVYRLLCVPGPYGGAVGYVSFHGNMDMAITIRTACIQNDKLIVRAGAGIVADSDPERERIETRNKAMAIQKALELLQR